MNVCMHGLVGLQVLLADHEVLQDQIVTVEMSNQRLVNANEQLAAEVAWYKLENEKVCARRPPVLCMGAGVRCMGGVRASCPKA